MTDLAIDQAAADAIRVRSLLPAVRKSLLSSALSIAVFSVLLFRFSPVGLSIWIGLRIVVTVGCLIALARLTAEEVTPAAATRGMTILMAVSGIVWGLIPLFVRPAAAEWGAVVVLWLFGNQSVITAVCSPSRPVFGAAIGSVTVVGALMIALPGGAFAFTLAAVLLLGGAYSFSIFQALNRVTDAAIVGQLQAASLTTSLRERQSELESANAALDHLASVDSLTGLANRRAFESSLSDSDGRLLRSGWLGILDVDRFKSINDRFGHHVGDVVLTTLARRWSRSLPAGVVLARTGGDEFALGISDGAEADATELLELLLDRAREPISADGSMVRVTCSVGLAPVEVGELYTAALKGADRVLYQVKASGRDAHAVGSGDGPDDEVTAREGYTAEVGLRAQAKD